MKDMATEASSSPAGAYWARQQLLAAEAARSQRNHFLLGYLRVLLALTFLAFAWMALMLHLFSPLWIVLPAAVFVVAARVHSRVLRERSLARRAVAFYEHGLARAQDQWIGFRPRRTRADTSKSLYATDLGLFAEGGMFELLCTARTRMGEDTLAEWLLQPASAPAVRERHTAVRELRERFEFREDMGVNGSEARPESRSGLDTHTLLAWAESDTPLLPPWLTWVAPLLLLITLASVGLSILWHNLAPFVLMLIVDALFTFGLQSKVNKVLSGARRSSEALRLFSALIALVESETFTAARLQALQRQCISNGDKAATAIRGLARLAEFVDYRLNYLVKILDAPLLYSLQLATHVQRWRARHGRDCRTWLAALGEMEALLSLAAYSYEHPDDTFPELLEGAPSFEAEGLGHPLLPPLECVRNNVALGGAARLLLISGSNMSGKSTLLRAVGVNTVLAMAGAPVCAARLSLTPLRVGADIGINDSLEEGVSRFYAEILRLGEIWELAEAQPPVLFLLDELLGGTNSADRLTGARGVAHALLRSGAIGMISTHDLALAEIGSRDTQAPDEKTLDRAMRQMHFDERIVDRRMSFDYVLKDGPATSRNGVELMRLIGLKV